MEFLNTGLLVILALAIVYNTFKSSKSETSQVDQIAVLKKELEDIKSSQQNNFTNTLELLKSQLDSINKNIQMFLSSNDSKLESLKLSVEDRLYKIQFDNNEKLEKMRATVEEKLEATLEKRLSNSFKIVSDQLEQVHKSMGEMQTLATGVGDLKKVLSNVKTRGIWGEVQLEAILDQILTVDQYAKNVQINKSSQERVEFAIKIPSKDSDDVIWIPIDSKFPLDIYQQLLEAVEEGSVERINESRKALENAIKKEAKSISEKYISPPNTTDFAIMFLPTEGLYAEVLRITGLYEELQRVHKIIIAGPTTLAAILNSLQMGYRTLAIQKRSSEVWKILGTVKNEFYKFAEVLEKTKVKLDQASKEISNAEVRTRQIERQLNKVESYENDNLTVNPELDKLVG